MKKSQRPYHPSPAANRYSTEPTEQELLLFNTLLKSNNLEAQNALKDYSESQNKEQFYGRIINLCRHRQQAPAPAAAPHGAPPPPPATSARNANEPTRTVPTPATTRSVHASATTRSVHASAATRSVRASAVSTISSPDTVVVPTTTVPPTPATTNGISQNRKENKRVPMEQQPQDNTVPRRSNQEVGKEKKEIKSVCQFFQSGGICRKADQCRYQHSNGVREGNTWKDDKFERKSLPKKKVEKNDFPKVKHVVDAKPIDTEMDKKEINTEATEAEVPDLTVDDSLTNQKDEIGGESLLLDSNAEAFPIDHKNPQPDLSVTLETSNGTKEEERIRIFEFLVDHNDRPLLSDENPEDSESLWMALNLAKINNSFEDFPETDNVNLLRTRKENPKKSEELIAQETLKDRDQLFRSDNFRADPAGAEEFPIRAMFPPSNQVLPPNQTPNSTDPKFPPSNFPLGPEYPFYPHLPPHMMPPPHLGSPFIPPGYHPAMGYPPHMMMPPFSHFPGMFPPHMPPFQIPPPDMRSGGGDGQIHSPNMPPRMPFPYGYPFPYPQSYGENFHSSMPPQSSDNFREGDVQSLPISNTTHPEAAQPSKARDLELAAQSVGSINSTDYDTVIGISQQETSRFRFEEATYSNNSVSDNSQSEVFPPKLTPTADPVMTSHVKTPDPKGQVLLSFLRSNTTSPQTLSNLPLKSTPTPESSQMNQTEDETELVTNSQETETKEDHTPQHRLYRVTRNQPGRIRVSIRSPHGKSSGTDESSIIPGGHMVVYWELPFDIWRLSSKSLVIALTRLGSSSNSNNLVTKDLNSSKNCQPKRIRIHPNSPEARGLMNEDKEHEVLQGEIAFHAPKAAGSYVYRIFDNSSDEKRYITLATSDQFVVELRGRDVAINLKFAIEAIGKTKSDIGSLGALRNTFELMRSTGTPFQGRSPQSLIQECVQLVLDVIQKNIPILNERDEARKAQLLEKLDETTDDVEGKADPVESSDNPIWQKARAAQRVHLAAHDCLSALRGNFIAWGMLSPTFRQSVTSYLNQFCQFERRFFDNLNDMYATRSLDFGFIPCPAIATTTTSAAARALSTVMKQRLENLMPSSVNFNTRREEVRARLKKQLCERHVLPVTADLVVFGSSRNNFGSEGADLDMCLQYGDAATVPIGEERSTVMEALGAALTEMGMSEVQTRSTARIPIVIFRDPISGLDCDISFNNPLAIRNTLLLASYSAVDIRVRELAFIIKYWAKQRHINNPQEGTLSSYGYILCLIHFLQIRSPNLLPNLQTIPPDWEPNRPIDSRSSLPKRWEKHPVEDCYCNTYFYDVTHKRDLQKCQTISNSNHQTIGELLIEFFRYFAYEFDFHSQIISIRSGSKSVSKLYKAEVDCWSPHDRLSIEDPFESWYDVAHVIKGTQMSYMRKEFLRAYTLICRSCVDDSAILGNLLEPDSLPRTVPLADLFDILTAPPSEIPKFASKQARSRANTLVATAAEDGGGHN